MPAEEIAGGLARILMHFLIEIVLELLIKGPGHVLMHVFRPGKPRSEVTCTMLGLAFWALVILAVWLLLR